MPSVRIRPNLDSAPVAQGTGLLFSADLSASVWKNDVPWGVPNSALKKRRSIPLQDFLGQAREQLGDGSSMTMMAVCL